MKRYNFHRVLIVVFALVLSANIVAQSPKREFRAAWLATAWGIDWPSVKGTTAANVETQKNQLIQIFNNLQANNFTAVHFQVRRWVDAVYPSAYVPWSRNVSSAEGVAPYNNTDYLKFAIEEAHKRGLELHVWLNPYHYSGSISGRAGLSEANTLAASLLNPADPAVKTHITNVVNELITNYDIDGIAFDDYFYKGVVQNSPDEKEVSFYNASGYTNIGDWRREQINQMVKSVRLAIDNSEKPWIRFGIGPAGVYSTAARVVKDESGGNAETIAAPTYKDSFNWTYDGSGEPYDNGKNGSATAGATISGANDNYNTLFCDGVTWLKRGYIDYIAPQVYWQIRGKFDYRSYVDWWATQAQRYNRQFYVSQEVDESRKDWEYNNPVGHSRTIEEIRNQVTYNRGKSSDVQGSIFYNTSNLINRGFAADLKTNFYQQKALAPEIDFREAGKRSGNITNFTRSGNTLSWSYNSSSWTDIDGKTSYPVRFTVYACNADGNISEAISNPQHLLGVSYTTTFALPDGFDNADSKQYAVCVFDRVGREVLETTNYRNSTSTDPAGSESCAAFSGSSTATFNTTALWKKQNGGSDVSDWLASGSGGVRNIAVHDNTLFAVNYNEKKLHFVNTSNGLRRKTININIDNELHLFCMRVTDNGEFLVGNSVNDDHSFHLFCLDTITGNCTELGSIPISQRGDGFDVWGNLKEGYIISALVNGQLLYAPLRGGQLISAEHKIWTLKDKNSNSITSGSVAWAAIQDRDYFFVCAGQNLPHYRYHMPSNLSTTSINADNVTWSTPPSLEGSNGSGGNACVRLKWRDFYISPYGKYGEIRVFDTSSNTLAPAHKGSTAAIASAASTSTQITVIAQEMGEKVYIYVLAPFQGIAKYELNIVSQAKTLSVDNITSTSATFHGKIDDYDAGCIREVAFEIQPCNGGKNVAPAVGNFINTTFSATSYNLEYDTRYKVRARVLRYPSSENGPAYGGYIYFRTLGPTIITQAATNIKDETATINGISILKAGFTPIKCGFKYRKKGTSDWTEVLESSGAIVRTNTNISANLSGLTSTTTYEYQAFVQLPQGTYTGEIMEFTTSRPQFVIQANEIRTIPNTFTAANPGDIIIYKGGQADNASTVAVNGKIQLKWAFERNIYYPIIFPFDVAKVTYGNNKEILPKYQTGSGGQFLLKQFVDNEPEMQFVNRWENTTAPGGGIVIRKNVPYILQVQSAALHNRELTFHSTEGSHSIVQTLAPDRGTSTDYQYFGNNTLKNQEIGAAWVMNEVHDQVLFANQGSSTIPAFECYVQIEQQQAQAMMMSMPYIGFVARDWTPTTELNELKQSNLLTIWSDHTALYVSSQEQQTFTIFTTTGQRISTHAVAPNETIKIDLPPAVYIITSNQNNTPLKVVL